LLPFNSLLFGFQSGAADSLWKVNILVYFSKHIRIYAPDRLSGGASQALLRFYEYENHTFRGITVRIVDVFVNVYNEEIIK